MKIYMIEKLWILDFETKAWKTFGYEIIGYTSLQEAAEEIVQGCREYDVNDCWAIEGKLPEYRYTIINEIK